MPRFEHQTPDAAAEEPSRGAFARKGSWHSCSSRQNPSIRPAPETLRWWGFTRKRSTICRCAAHEFCAVELGSDRTTIVLLFYNIAIAPSLDGYLGGQKTLKSYKSLQSNFAPHQLNQLNRLLCTYGVIPSSPTGVCHRVFHVLVSLIRRKRWRTQVIHQRWPASFDVFVEEPSHVLGRCRRSARLNRKLEGRCWRFQPTFRPSSSASSGLPSVLGFRPIMSYSKSHQALLDVRFFKIQLIQPMSRYI